MNNKVFRKYLIDGSEPIAGARPTSLNICRLIISTDANDNSKISKIPASTSDFLEKVYPGVTSIKPQGVCKIIK